MKKANTLKKTAAPRPAKKAQIATKTVPVAKPVIGSVGDVAELLFWRLNDVNRSTDDYLTCERLGPKFPGSDDPVESLLSGVVIGCIGNIVGFFRRGKDQYVRRSLLGVRVLEHIVKENGTWTDTVVCETDLNGVITLTLLAHAPKGSGNGGGPISSAVMTAALKWASKAPGIPRP